MKTRLSKMISIFRTYHTGKSVGLKLIQLVNGFLAHNLIEALVFHYIYSLYHKFYGANKVKRFNLLTCYDLYSYPNLLF